MTQLSRNRSSMKVGAPSPGAVAVRDEPSSCPAASFLGNRRINKRIDRALNRANRKEAKQLKRLEQKARKEVEQRNLWSAIGPVQPDVEGEACSMLRQGRFVDFTRIGKYSLFKRMGSGSFGQVYAGQSTDTFEPVAIKVLKNESVDAKKGKKQAVSAQRRINMEISLLQSHSHHPNIIGFHEVIHGPQNFYLVLEKGRCDLRTWLKSSNILRRRPRLDITGRDFVQQVMKGILNGISYLHSQGVFHLDLKPQNIVIASCERGGPYHGGRVKASDIRLCDFGVSISSASLTPVGQKPVKTDVTLGPGFKAGTPGYTAPELVLGLGGSAADADIFSIGCTMAYMLNNCSLPKQLRETGHDLHSYRNALLSYCNKKSERETRRSPFSKFMFKHLLVFNAHERSCAEEALEQSFFQEQHCMEEVIKCQNFSAKTT